MELEDLKVLWHQSSNPDAAYLKKEDFEESLHAVLKQKDRIRSSFRLELWITASIYAGFIITALFLRNSMQSYMFKMVAVVTALGIPILIRLYRSIQWKGNPDYSKDISSYLTERIIYFRKTLKFYLWASYGIIIITATVFFTDDSFNKLSLFLKCLIAAYLLVFAALLKPYIKKMYGDKLAIMEDLITP